MQGEQVEKRAFLVFFCYSSSFRGDIWKVLFFLLFFCISNTSTCMWPQHMAFICCAPIVLLQVMQVRLGFALTFLGIVFGEI